MKISEEINKMKDQYDRDIRLLSLLIAVEHLITHVTSGVIYTIDTTYEEIKNTLHTFSSIYGKYTMMYYYINNGRLAILYKFDNFELQIFCTDVENALNKVGGGKCRIEETTETVKHVVCDI